MLGLPRGSGASEKLSAFSRVLGLLGHLTVSKCLCTVLRPAAPQLREKGAGAAEGRLRVSWRSGCRPECSLLNQQEALPCSPACSLGQEIGCGFRVPFVLQQVKRFGK